MIGSARPPERNPLTSPSGTPPSRPPTRSPAARGRCRRGTPPGEGSALARRRLLLGLPAAALARPAAAEETVAATAVEPPDRLVLADGRRLRLAGLVVPGALSPAPAEAGRVAAAAALLEALATGPLAAEPLATDRLGRIEALVRAADGRLLQEALVEAGLAYVTPDGLPVAAARTLLAAEARARAAGRGLWADPRLAEQPAERVAAEPPRYAVVRGRVREAGRSEAFAYLNFGTERRRDFTVRIPAGALRALRRAGLEPDRLVGRSLRVRGWLFEAGGAMMEVEEALQLEVLE